MLSIGLFVPLLERYWPVGEPDRSWVGRLQRWWRGSILVSLGCWLGIAPLIAWHYHLMSPVTIIANLFVVPLLGVIIGLGMLLVTVDWCGWMVALVAWPTSACIHLLLRGVEFLARVPGGWWTVTPPWWLIAAGYLGLVWWWRAHRAPEHI